MRTSLKNIALVCAGLVTGVLATIQLSATAQNATTPLPLDELRQLSTVFEGIKQNYVEPVNDKKLLTDAIRGMVNSLDPHSEYLDKKAFKELDEHIKGQFGGLGIEISSEDGLVKVMNPIEDTPAARAGLQAGDLITRLDAKSVRGMTLNQAVKTMRGEPGTKITLTIYRKSEERTFPVTITRAEIKVQSVKAKIVAPDIAWVRITAFQERTVSDLGKKLAALAKENPNLKGLILDLRNNGGGLLPGAIGVSAAFLPHDSVVVSAKGQSPDAKRVYKADLEDYQVQSDGNNDPLAGLPEKFKTIPMVVLVNAYSASASEIVSGALQDYKRAKIMGKTTYGKASVQTSMKLSEDTAYKITIAYYYTPSGKSIQAVGIKPDMVVDQNAEGDPDDVLISREIDAENHLKNKQQDEGDAMTEREQRRLDELQRLEEENEKKTPEQREKDKKKKPIEFGSKEDFMLQQAEAYLLGQPVQLSKSKLETYNASEAAGKPAKSNKKK